MQDIVVGNKTLHEVAKPNEIVQLLLTDDQLTSASLEANANRGTSKAVGKRPAGADTAMGDLWNEEGDEFFGGQSSGAQAGATNDGDEDAPPVVTSGRGRRGRGRGGRGASGESTPRGGRRGRGRKKAVAADMDS